MVVGPRVLCMVLAGGQGRRLWPLTADRAKPAVPFGGNFRLVDLVLSNLVNSGFRRIFVLTQYKSHSLSRYIASTWRMSQMLGSFVIPVPAQQRVGPRWYSGSADALLQSLTLVLDQDPEYVIVCGADHVYRMDFSQLLADHLESGAEVTVAGIRVPRSAAADTAVIDVDDTGRRIIRFQATPAVPGEIGAALVSMGIGVVSVGPLIQALRRDADDHDSAHDVGASIIPMFVARGTANVYDFDRNQVPGALPRDRGYFRDIGTLDDYYAAHMDLVSVHPIFNLYNQWWPILSVPPIWPPAKFGENGTAMDSMVGPGTIVSGATVTGSVVSYNVRVAAGASVQGSVLLPGVRIGRHALVRNAILDKNVIIGDGMTVGINPDADRVAYTLTPAGITVLGKGATVTGP